MLGREFMRYRVTTRGKIVIVVLVILLIAGTTSIVSPNNHKQIAISSQETSVEGSETSQVLEETIDTVVPSDGAVDLTKDEETNIVENEKDEDKSLILEEAACRLYFKPDKYDILMSEIPKLQEIINISKQFPEEIIIVESNINGYPDYNDSEFGLKLSDMRVEVVKKYLVDKGLSEDRIYVFSLGSQKPIENTNNLLECWKNRRTDVYFKDYNSLEY